MHAVMFLLRIRLRWGGTTIDFYFYFFFGLHAHIALRLIRRWTTVLDRSVDLFAVDVRHVRS